MPRVRRSGKVVEAKLRLAEIDFFSLHLAVFLKRHIFISGYVDFKFDFSLLRD